MDILHPTSKVLWLPILISTGELHTKRRGMVPYHTLSPKATDSIQKWPLLHPLYALKIATLFGCLPWLSSPPQGLLAALSLHVLLNGSLLFMDRGLICGGQGDQSDYATCLF